MTVVAHCSDCNDTHPVGDRLADWTTTRCPVCGSTTYGTEATEGESPKSEAERIADAISNVRGVGEETKENIVEEFGFYAELEGASVDQLADIDNVGETTAERIKEAV